MTKLQFLNAFFADRLMAAMQEIMQVVGDTLIEYQEETDRTKRENEFLRRRLQWAGLDDEAAIPKSAPPLFVDRHVAGQQEWSSTGQDTGSTLTAPPLSADRHVAGQQEWSSTGQDTESTLTAVKLEFTELQRDRQEEEEHQGLEPATDGSVIPSPCSKRECDRDSLIQPTFPSPCGKRDCKQDSQSHHNLKMQIGNTEEEDPVPNVIHYQVKTETDGVDYNISEQPAETLFTDILNPASETVHSENSVRVNEDESSHPVLLSEQHSKEKQSLLQGESSLSCVYCGKVFIHAYRLKSHLRIHTEDDSYRCSVCGKCFSRSAHLNIHQRVHTGKKPYCCNMCGKSFFYSGEFKKHQRFHAGERPYRCSYCGKYFSQSGHLRTHVRIHTGEKPYRCPVCGNCFSHLSQIKKHLLTHTEKI